MELQTQDEQVLTPPAAPVEGAAVPAPAKPPKIACLLPSLTDLAFLLPIWWIAAAPGGVSSLLEDADSGWHMRTGEWILAHGRVPDQDLFSFTKAGERWFAWEWLWDVTVGWLHLHWGLAAVVLLSMALIATTCALVYRMARWKSGNPALAIGLTVVAISACSVHWWARPHLSTMLLTMAFLFLLERAGAGEMGRLKWLPVLMVLWTNLHGGFVAGLVLVGAYAAGELAGAVILRAGPERTAAWGRCRRYALAGLACGAATLVNPYGWELHRHIATYLTTPYHYDTISEFQSMSFHGGAAKYVEVMIVLAVIAAAWELSRKRFVYPILVLGWLHFALYSVRNVPLLVLVSVAPAAAMLEAGLARLETADVAGWVGRAARSLRTFGTRLAEIDLLPRIPVLPVAGVVLLGALLWAPPSERLTARYSPEYFPVRAAGFLQEAGLLHNLCSTDQWGDYLIYRLYPNVRVFTDGRSDFYGGKFGADFLRLMRGDWRWERLLDQYRIENVLLPADLGLASTLKESPRWRLVYDDGVANVFHRGEAPATGPGLPGPPPRTAAPGGGQSAIARSPSINPVIDRSQSYARR